jgi:hypothetical protein
VESEFLYIMRVATRRRSTCNNLLMPPPYPCLRTLIAVSLSLCPYLRILVSVSLPSLCPCSCLLSPTAFTCSPLARHALLLMLPAHPSSSPARPPCSLAYAPRSSVVLAHSPATLSHLRSSCARSPARPPRPLAYTPRSPT